MKIRTCAIWLLMLSAAISGPVKAQTLLLNSFETAADLAKLSATNATFAQSIVDVTNSKHSLKVVFQPSASPTLVINSPTYWNLSSYSGIAMDVSNPSTADIVLNVSLHDTSSPTSTHETQNSFTIPAGQTITLAEPLSGVYVQQFFTQGMQTSPLWFPGLLSTYAWVAPANFSSATIYSISLSLSSPSAAQTLIFDNVRAVSSVAPANIFSSFVDEYGQFNRMSWTGKVNTDADFATQESAEQSDLAANPATPVGWDTYGGWTGGPKQTAAGYFRTAEVGGKWWLVDPIGNLFFSTGFDAISSDQETTVTGRTQMFASLPTGGTPSSVTGLGSGAGWTINKKSYMNPVSPSISNGTAVLTDGAFNFTSSSIFYNTPVNVTTDWTVKFTYTNSNDAEGIAFVMQNDSLNAQGSSNTGLGYSIDPNNNSGGSQITNSAAVEIEGWDRDAYGGSGTSFDNAGVTFSPDGVSTSDVYYPSGTLNGVAIADNTTNVTLQYSVAGNDIVETLTQGSNTFTYTFTNVNLVGAVGSNTAWIGFTGSDGGDNGVNAISNFSFVGTSVVPPTINFYTNNLNKRYGTNYVPTWIAKTYKRMKSWGFNTVGVWSDSTFTTNAQLPYIIGLYTYSGYGTFGNYNTITVGAYTWATVPDAFDPVYTKTIAAEFAGQMSGKSTDRELIGYYADNELIWQGPAGPLSNYAIPITALTQTASTSPVKQAFVNYLTSEYGTIAKLNTAWGTTFASWAALSAPYTVPATPSAGQMNDLSSLMSLYAGQYYKVISQAIKSIDPNHLYLGSKFDYPPQTEVLKAAATYCDVLSYDDYNTIVGGPTTYSAVNKPVIMAEFQFGALDTGLFFFSLGPTDNQICRAKAFTTYANSAIVNPNVVGYQWFQYTDEPITGRPLDGENGNVGFVTVTDTVYQDLVGAARAVQSTLYSTRYQ